MSSNAKTHRLTVLGVHVKSDGYPNVTQRIRALKNMPDVVVHEINVPFQSSSKHAGMYGARFLRITRFVLVHMAIGLRLLTSRSKEIVYIPYPAALVLWMWSWVPKILRPQRIVVDAFISWYDTAVVDRELLAATSFVARLIHRIEARAYRLADQLLVDTPLNRQYFIDLFKLDAKKVIDLPLAIDEQAYMFQAYSAVTYRCTVLFVGTFVPLQGIEVIVAAMRLLQHRSDIDFRIIGDGQQAKIMEGFTTANPGAHVTWIRNWLPAAEIAAEISRADICLGIFGSGAKTQRVWPLKNYGYMSVGRALITGDTACARLMATDGVPKAFVSVPCGDAESLARSIEALADAPDLRSEYAQRARSYYLAHMSVALGAARLASELFENP